MTIKNCAMNDQSFDELAYLRAEVKRLRKALSLQSPRIDVLLRRRGFKIYKKEPADDLLIPSKKYLNDYYKMLHKYSFRLFIRDVIKHQELFTLEDVARYATPSVTREYLDYLQSIKLIKKRTKGYALARGPITSFGTTLEWYIAEVFRREFGEGAVWGVKFKRPRVGGDYDVIAKLDGSLLYIEVKSSPPKQIYDSEIMAFLDRVADLAPAIAVFLMDTELRMKDKLVPMFEKELQKRYKVPPKVVRMERELFQIEDRIFIVNAKESIIQNIEKVVSWHYQHSSGLS
ncbi:MAG: hypothetical protein ACM3MD_04715 [Betaproteobacteria bacterium]